MNKINNLLQILFGCFFLIFFNKTVKAQIIPDNTLGVEASRLTPNVLINGVNADKIDGGAQRGINLFHSFSEFNINNGQRIYFANPSGIENILTRVTGNSAANIFGILGVDGNANLFLINPNGILFGENARLDVRGSFVATTANAVQFGEQGFFQATNPEPPPLLTIQPSALFFSRINTNSQGITNRIRPNANDAALNSSFAPQQGSRYWVGGNIIGTSADGRFVSGLGSSTNQNSTGDAGDLTIKTQDLLVRDGAIVNTGTYGTGKGGNLTVNASGTVEIIGTSADGRSLSALGASAGSGSTGDAGDLTINTQDLLVQDGAQISASTSGRGKGGNLTVNASKKVELIGTSADGSILSGLGASVQEGSTGDAGSLTIKTQDLLVRDGAAVSTATFGTGKGGNLIINAANSVQLTGTSADGSISGVSTSAYAGSIGDAGNLQVDTQNIIVRDGAQISASTFSSGRGGNLTVNASRQFELIGRSADGRFPSGLFASAERDSTGDAGDLKVDTQNLFISDRAGVFVNSQGTGNAGIMTINASRIRLDNKAFLNANTSSPNKDPNREQATINLNTGALILSHNSNIVTNATGENVIGGNININADVLAALQNSDISANSSNFRGGRVRITSQRIFGTQTRDFPTPESDITATGANPALSGSTEINQPDLDPSQGTIELPQTIIDPDALIAQNPCLRRGGSEFIVTGKGGLPPSPSQALHTDILEVDLLEPAALTITPTQPPTKTSNDISQQQPVAINANKVVPAQGWVADGDEVILTAYAANGTKIQRQAHSISVCPAK